MHQPSHLRDELERILRLPVQLILVPLCTSTFPLISVVLSGRPKQESPLPFLATLVVTTAAATVFPDDKLALKEFTATTIVIIMISIINAVAVISTSHGGLSRLPGMLVACFLNALAKETQEEKENPEKRDGQGIMLYASRACSAVPFPCITRSPSTASSSDPLAHSNLLVVRLRAQHRWRRDSMAAKFRQACTAFALYKNITLHISIHLFPSLSTPTVSSPPSESPGNSHSQGRSEPETSAKRKRVSSNCCLGCWPFALARDNSHPKWKLASLDAQATKQQQQQINSKKKKKKQTGHRISNAV